MDERLEFVALALSEGANVRALCRRFKVSPDTGYKWITRYRAGGVESLRDRSRRPHTSPRRSNEAVEQRVLEMRRSHPAWGGRKIRARLLQLGCPQAPAESTISDILRRHGLLHLERPAPAPFVRFERPEPNQLWQMDFKGHVPLARGGRCHPLTMIDDRSRYCLCLQACGNQHEATAKMHLTAAFRRYGLPEQLLCDNGSPWGSAGEECCYTALEVWLLRVGIVVTHGRIRHPQTQGKDERFHRTLKAELLCRQDLLDNTHAQSLFDPWRHMYNTERPHQALDLATPATRYRVSSRPFPEVLPDLGYQHGEEIRKVHQHGRICYRGSVWRIGKAFVGEQLVLRPSTRDGVLNACYGPHVIAEIDLRTPGLVIHRRRSREPLAADASSSVHHG
jgi:transposase InsO family protein